MVSAGQHTRTRRDGFTLIEAVLALAISAVVLAAIGGVFYSALRLRDRTFAALNEINGLQPALTILKRDLRGVMPPDGVLASSFRCGSLGGFMGRGYGLQFITTTARLDDGLETPGGDLQEVIYTLREPSIGPRNAGMELVRMVNRNLLATIPDVPEEETLLTGVQDFTMECYDGYEWRTDWDTTLSNTNLPVAVRVELKVAPREAAQNAAARRDTTPGVQIIVPLLAKSRTNAVAGVEETTE